MMKGRSFRQKLSQEQFLKNLNEDLRNTEQNVKHLGRFTGAL